MRYSLVLVLLLCSLFFVGSVEAISYTIVAPAGQLVRDQEYDFTVNVNTDEQAITSGRASVTFQSQYLQYVSTTPGDFFATVTYTPGTSTVELVGTNTSAKSGSGTFATVRFKLIATAPGSTELCTVAEVPTTPTVTIVPTTAIACFSSCTSSGSSCPSGMSCLDVNAGTGASALYRCVVRTSSGCSSNDQTCWCNNPTITPTAIQSAGMTTGMMVGASAALLIAIGLLTLFVL